MLASKNNTFKMLLFTGVVRVDDVHIN